MAGRFVKAPLIYMTARISTTSIPSLTGDQKSAVEHAMVKCDLPIKQVGSIKEFGVSIQTGEMKPSVDTRTRLGFFSVDRKNALIVDAEHLEWRTSGYTTYNEICERIVGVLDALCEAVDTYGHLPVRELTLSYVDFIAPREGRALLDYFSSGSAVLPLSMLAGSNTDIQRSGHVQVNRIVEANKRIFVSLEELPASNNLPVRYLPQHLMEPDNTFTMPIHIHQGWENIFSTHYGLLTTQAAKLMENVKLMNFGFVDGCEPIHELTRDTFQSLIKREICDVDWEFVEDEQGIG